MSSTTFVHTHLRFNFWIGLIDGGFFGLGMGFGSFVTVLPLFVSHFTDSALLIGLIPAIHGAGWQLPQWFAAGYTARARYVKPLVMRATLHERLPFLGLALLALVWFELPASAILVLTFGLILWQSLGGGFAANPWQTMVTKVIPAELHGTFFGAQSAVFNGVAGLASIAAGVLLQRLDTPWDFALCFLFAFVGFMISYIALGQTREFVSAPSLSPPSGEVMWSRSWEIFRRNRNFNVFLLARSLSQFAGMAISFYIVYAVRKLGISESVAGVMTSVLLMAQVGFAPLMGRLGDRWSHRGVMTLGGAGATISSLLAWLAPSVVWFYLVFLLAAVAIVAIWTVPLALTVRFASDESERPLYIGLSNTISAPATILAPIFGGWLADTLGYEEMFLVAALFGLLMMVVLVFFVQEPDQAHSVSTVSSSLQET